MTRLSIQKGETQEGRRDGTCNKRIQSEDRAETNIRPRKRKDARREGERAAKRVQKSNDGEITVINRYARWLVYSPSKKVVSFSTSFSLVGRACLIYTPRFSEERCSDGPATFTISRREPRGEGG